jgi:hypothetical protein
VAGDDRSGKVVITGTAGDPAAVHSRRAARDGLGGHQRLERGQPERSVLLDAAYKEVNAPIIRVRLSRWRSAGGAAERGAGLAQALQSSLQHRNAQPSDGRDARSAIAHVDKPVETTRESGSVVPKSR